MKRIISVLAVVALMAMLLVAMAAPAFAAPECTGFDPEKGPRGQERAAVVHDNPSDIQDFQFLKHSFKSSACAADEPPSNPFPQNP